MSAWTLELGGGLAGEPVEQSIHDLAAIAKKLGVFVAGSCNGIRIVIAPDATDGDVAQEIERYHEEFIKVLGGIS